jgi:hypothetical protein
MIRWLTKAVLPCVLAVGIGSCGSAGHGQTETNAQGRASCQGHTQPSGGQIEYEFTCNVSSAVQEVDIRPVKYRSRNGAGELLAIRSRVGPVERTVGADVDLFCHRNPVGGGSELRCERGSTGQSLAMRPGGVVTGRLGLNASPCAAQVQVEVKVPAPGDVLATVSASLARRGCG